MTFFMSVLLAVALGPVALVYLEGEQAEGWLLSHCVLGLVMLLLLPWLATHLRKREAGPVSSLLDPGVLSTAVLMGALLSGGLLAGAYCQNRYGMSGLAPVHLGLGYLLLVLLPVHLFGHAKDPLAAARRWFWIMLGAGALSIGVTAGLRATGGWSSRVIEGGPQASVETGESPFFPSQLETPHGQRYSVDSLTGDRDCAPCHQQIVEESSQGTHRFTGIDNEIVLTGYLPAQEARGLLAARFCASCHEPVALLSGKVTSDLPSLDSALTGHGTTCQVCHGIRSVNGAGGQVIEPPDKFGFSGSESRLGQWANRLLVRSFVERHRQEMSPPLLRESLHCSGCHNVNANEGFNGWGFFPLHNEFGNWANSMFARGLGTEGRQIACQDCHMFQVSGSTDPVAARKGGTHSSHRFLGANTFVALHYSTPEQLALTNAYLTGDLVREEIADLVEPGPVISVFIEAPDQVSPGQVLQLAIGLYNRAVGHAFPEGAIEVHDTWLEVTASELGGEPFYTSGGLDALERRDPDAYVLNATPVNRAGEEIFLTGGLAVAFSERTSIPSGHARSVRYSIPVPRDIEGPIQVRARLRYRRVDDAFRARMKSKMSAGDVPITDVADSSVLVPTGLER